MWNEALILLIAQMSCLPICLRPSLHRSEHRCRGIGANAHDYLMVYDIYVIEPIVFHLSPTWRSFQEHLRFVFSLPRQPSDLRKHRRKVRAASLV